MRKFKLYKKHIKETLIFFALVLFGSTSLFSQDYNLPIVRDSLHFYFKSIAVEKFDSNKINLNKNILRIIRNSLSVCESYNTPIDSVANLGLTKSKNNRLRFYTWNIPLNDGTHKYFGFIHYYDKKEKQYIRYELYDNSVDLKNPEYLILSNKNWFGSLLYKIVEIKHKGDTYYILLSSDLNDMLTKKKIIDVLQFDKNNFPVFGAKIFKNQPNNTRIFFEYNARANMTLTYDEKLKMIVFDHLSPSKPSLTGVYEFYGPDFSYDGYKFEKGMLVLYPDIDLRNSK